MIGPHGPHATYVWAAYAITALGLAWMTIGTLARASRWRGRAGEQERLRNARRPAGAPSVAPQLGDTGETRLVSEGDPPKP